MGDTTNQVGERYWLLVGSAPAGPFAIEQIHAKLAAGEITWQSRACRLGTIAWLPLVETPGLGPMPVPEEIPSVIPVPPTAVIPGPKPVLMLQALPADADVARATGQDHLEWTATPAMASTPAGQRSSPARRLAGVAVAALAVAFVGWLGYEWLRPLTPREVCERFDNARTAKEASPYCTLNLQPALETIFRRQQEVHPKDKFEYTQEGDAPANLGGYFVGARGQIYFPEENRFKQIDFIYHLIKSDGWKIEDMYVLSLERQPLPGPISIARKYQLLIDQNAGGEVQEAARNGPAGAAPVQAKQWYDNRGVQQATTRGIGHFLTPAAVRRWVP
jgi:hypothetical protein